MKKILISLLLLLSVTWGVTASASVRQGQLFHSNMTAEECYNFFSQALSNDDEYVWDNYKIDRPEYAPYVSTLAECEYFDSLSEMLMALDSSKIDRIELCQPVAEYFFKLKGNNEKYVPYVITKGVTYYLSMGFKEGSKWFEPFNATIKAMAEDKTLLFLKAQYVMDADENIKPVKFDKFPDAETVKIAVTGDMPPIDYVAADGTPAGFNTAMLAEIARRLKINVELVSINSGARASSLASGRADGVFWFWYDKATKTPRDIPIGVSLTEPYYSWDTFIYVGKKLHK